MSTRGLVALVVGLAVAIAAGVALAVAMTGDPGDDTTAGRDGQQPGGGAGNGSGDTATLQDQFGALGSWAAAGPLQCQDDKAGPDEQSALSCRLDDVSVRMVTFDTTDALMADRDEWVHRVKTRPDAVMTRTPAATVVHDPSTRTVYWDSASAQQSAVLQYSERTEAAALFASIATGLELPAPPGLLPSTELLEFAPDEIQPAGCHLDPELPVTADEIVQLICPLGAGYEVRLVEVFERSTLVLERNELENGIRDKPGTLVRGLWFADQDADRPAGAIIEFIHGGAVNPEDGGEARLYWDDPACLCWGVLWAPDGDQVALRDYWEDGTRVSSLE